MALDPYTPCPGGLDKKLKFCCPDLMGELDKAVRMFEGDQRVAATEFLTRLSGKYPQRACIELMRSVALTSEGRLEDARDVVDGLLAFQPQNAVGLAQRAETRVFRSASHVTYGRTTDSSSLGSS